MDWPFWREHSITPITPAILLGSIEPRGDSDR